LTTCSGRPPTWESGQPGRAPGPTASWPKAGSWSPGPARSIRRRVMLGPAGRIPVWSIQRESA